MNSLDIFFLVLIGASVLYSLVRGLVREIFSLLAIVLAFLGAAYGYSALAPWIDRWVGGGMAAPVLSFAGLFVALALTISLLGRLFSRLVRKTDLRWLDRAGGAAFGPLKAILLIAIIFLVLAAFLPEKAPLLSQSRISPAAVALAGGLSSLLPRNLQDLYRKKAGELKKNWALQELGEGPAEGRKGKK